eukprot:TRINITY_DN11701_c0_g1_i1.p1 TRINITY_DN11701_c0_g1~~TRINITY_DN11701_c0_g1_i1.p1  ORF type:complete len:187 (+),score=8.70 TRINITY_DN11701_c0_g1_i1:553-1113(+)
MFDTTTNALPKIEVVAERQRSFAMDKLGTLNTTIITFWVAQSCLICSCNGNHLEISPGPESFILEPFQSSRPTPTPFQSFPPPPSPTMAPMSPEPTPIPLDPTPTSLEPIKDIIDHNTSTSNAPSPERLVPLQSTRSNRAPVGAILGGVLGGICVLLVIGFLVWRFRIRPVAEHHDPDQQLSHHMG